MIYWLWIGLAVLSAIALASFLWGARQHALLRRVHAGVVTLAQGRDPIPLQRSSEDTEPILSAFDHLASQVAEERRVDTLAERGREMEVALERLITTLRQPLVAIQSYVALIRQAPEIPPAGDTHDLVQKLHSQINGLLALFQESTNVSELREAIYGLERQMAGEPADRMSRSVLLVDEENPWTMHMVQALKPVGLYALLAPGADAAAIMARVIHPRAIIANVGRHDGLGWRALPPLLRERRLALVPILLYRLTADGLQGSMWMPQEVLFWPIVHPEELRSARQRICGDNQRYAIHGDIELGRDIAGWLSEVDIDVVPSDDPPPLILEGCVSLSLTPDADDTALGRSFILIVPTRLLQEDAQSLVASIEKEAQKSAQTIAGLEKTLLESLRPVAEAVVKAQRER
jgi:hypothetical protein